jgi:putative phosphoribosyl transferase
MYFRDRIVAGRQLGAELARRGFPDPVVLGLPRGGVPVAAEVARALGAPLDVLVVRKVGAPFQPELAVGAVAQGVTALSEELIAQLGLRRAEVEAVAEVERGEVARRTEKFRRAAPRLDLRGKTAVIVDDGIATGATAHAAVEVARKLGAAKVVVAAPVSSLEARRGLRGLADEVVALDYPEPFMAVGCWYDDFRQTTDEEVVQLLAAAHEGRRAPAGAGTP